MSYLESAYRVSLLTLVSVRRHLAPCGPGSCENRLHGTSGRKRPSPQNVKNTPFFADYFVSFQDGAMKFGMAVDPISLYRICVENLQKMTPAEKGGVSPPNFDMVH